MRRIEAKKRGQLIVMHDGIKYKYSQLPYRVKFLLAREIRRFYPGYLKDYHRLCRKYSRQRAEQKVLMIMLKNMQNGIQS